MTTRLYGVSESQDIGMMWPSFWSISGQMYSCRYPIQQGTFSQDMVANRAKLIDQRLVIVHWQPTSSAVVSGRSLLDGGFLSHHSHISSNAKYCVFGIFCIQLLSRLWAECRVSCLSNVQAL